MANRPRPMSARVARRLAEAADGFRTGRSVWFVLDEKKMATVYAAHSVAEAEEMAAQHSGAAVYGPFLTPSDPKATKRVVTITLLYEDGNSVDIDAKGVDALFLSNAAREKFVYPYYARVLGPEAAATMKEEDEAEEGFGQHVNPSMYERGNTGHSEPTTYRSRGDRTLVPQVENAGAGV